MAELGFHLPSLVVFLVNFGILLAVLYFFGYKRILAMLDQRSERIRDSLSEADQVRSEATQARQDLEAQLGESRRAGQQVRADFPGRSHPHNVSQRGLDYQFWRMQVPGD